MGSLKRGETPLSKHSPSLIKGRGIKGEGYQINIKGGEVTVFTIYQRKGN